MVGLQARVAGGGALGAAGGNRQQDGGAFAQIGFGRVVAQVIQLLPRSGVQIQTSGSGHLTDLLLLS